MIQGIRIFWAVWSEICCIWQQLVKSIWHIVHYVMYIDMGDGTETVQVTPLRRTLASSP